MTPHRRYWLILWLLLFSLPLFCQPVVISRDQVRQGDVFAFSKDINIAGRVTGSIFIIGGRFVLDGKVEEDVVCIATEVIIQEGAIIGGNLIVFGGTLQRSGGAEIRGDYFNTPFNLKQIESTILPDLLGGGSLSTFRILKMLLWAILALLILALFYQNVVTGEWIMREHFTRVVMAGLWSVLIFIFLFLLFILLSFFVIGIPFAIALVLTMIGLVLFGRTVLFLTIGRMIGQGWWKMKNMPVVFILLGGFVYGLFKLIPVVGRFTILLSILELGVAALYLLRNRLRRKLTLPES